ncbi:MAG TPA: MarR family transcriptional regulator [Gemmatimonadaceae bacterium]|nr:MarR family transcriptional regulator [Gemmatimonadaceae bacterium]
MTKLTGPTGVSSVALSDLVCFDLYSAARMITRAYRPVLSGLGLTYPQYLVMVMLWQFAPRTVKDLGENLDLDSGTLSPLLKRLEASGLVTRRRRADDERTVEITPTPKGRALERAAQRVPIEIAAAMGISEAEEHKLRALLRKLTAALTAEEDDAPARAG